MQVIGYYSGSVRGTELADIISKTLQTLIANGIDVRGIICDQGSPNRTAYKKMGVTPEKPFVAIGDKKNCVLIRYGASYKKYKKYFVKI